LPKRQLQLLSDFTDFRTIKKSNMEMNIIHQSRAAQIGRSRGMIWLVSVTVFFALVDLYFAKLPVFFNITAGVIIFAITLMLLTRSFARMRLAKRLPNIKSEEATKRGASLRKWFIIIIAIEVAGFNIAPMALWKFNHLEYIVPVDILITALHFIPLGRIFSMQIYYVHGIILSLITVLTMLFVPASFQIGNLIALMAIPSTCFIFLNWIVVAIILKDATKYLHFTSPSTNPPLGT
jgi:hypothetical protein